MIRTLGALLGVGAAAAGAAFAADALVPRVQVTGPAGDTLVSATPAFTVRAEGVAPSERPVSVIIEVSARPDFGQLTYFDRALAESARFVPPRPLPSGIPIYWRGRVATAQGVSVSSAPVGPRVSAPWVHLVSPSPLGGVTLRTRRPTFIWEAAQIAAPPGPWRYDLTVENVATREILRYANLSTTQFLLPRNLEFNASYRWSVTARLGIGDSTTVRSPGSFVIADLTVPGVTLLYQNFPNPFPSATSNSTCIWFDIHEQTRVRVTVHDIRGQLVRTIIPTRGATDLFIAGRYGRGSDGESGCDPAFTWDGRDERGETVPTGVYLVRLRTASFESYKRVVFRGR